MPRNPGAIYTPEWRDAVRQGARSSMAVIAAVLTETFHPIDVIDVGAGEGWLSRAMVDEGAKAATDIDGPWVADRDGLIRGDLTAGVFPRFPSSSDLAVCLEVAEHLQPEVAPLLVEWLTTLAPIVVFSAAVPGQGGEGHVNERWPDYWMGLFAEHGWDGSGSLRWPIWNSEVVQPWYKQNLLVFAEAALLEQHDLELDGCPAVIHPEMWEWKGYGAPRRRVGR